MQSPVIVIDGKTYKSVSEMPPEVRARYEQAISAIPPAQGTNETPLPPFNALITSSTKFIVDGKEYNSLEELPPEARATYEQVMGTMDTNRNGMPDLLEGMLGLPPQAPAHTAATPSIQRPASPSPTPASPAITPDTTSGWMLVFLGGFLAVSCLLLAAGIWYFVLR